MEAALELQGSSPITSWIGPATFQKRELCGTARPGWQPWAAKARNSWADKPQNFCASPTFLSCS